MKKIVIIVACIIVVILAAAFIIPIAFKDQIKAGIDKALAESVDADIVWDVEDFNISLFRNFPHATASLNNFGIINRAPFKDQILFAVQEFEVEVDIFSLFGDQIKINGIKLNSPEIFIKVLEDGTANYDIALADSVSMQSESDTSAAAYNIGIDHWEITNGHIVYDDRSLPFKVELHNFQHSGSGDFTQDIIDVNTHTLADSVTLAFDGIEYVTNKRAEIDAILTISEDYTKYTFKENLARINDFSIRFDGFLAMMENGAMDMDINYGTKENTFKSLLSLVPGVYTESFKDVESEGTLSFSGGVKGKYDSLTLPAFNMALQVNDAMFKYPELPTAVENITMDLQVDHPNGSIDNTRVNLKQLHLNFGQDPFDAQLLIKNLVDYDMEARVKGQLNLQELNSMIPMEGITMKGAFNIDLEAAGVYDSVRQMMPKMKGTMSLNDGYIKTAELPYALESLNFNAEIADPTGKMSDFKAVVSNFNMVMDGEPFDASLVLNDLEDYTWDLKVKGAVDLEKITKVFPLEGTALTGHVKADIETAGKMSDLEAERYAKLPTRGTASIKNFTYQDKALPYDVVIPHGDASFDPQKITLSDLKGTIGKSDFAVDGYVSNYIAYLFGEQQTIKGTMNFSSNTLDLNEFMTEEEDAPSASQEAAYGVIQVPENIDFVLKSNIKSVKVMDMNITNATGDVIVREGVANLNGLKFNLLDGGFVVNGSYDARDVNKPRYNFDLGIQQLSIHEAFKTFTVVKAFAPIAEKVNGSVSTDFKLSGLLDENMMPNLATVTGVGVLKIIQASLDNSKIIQGITGLTKLADADKVTLKNVLMSVDIKDGKLQVKPFDVKLGNYTTTVAGATGFDGGIDFNLKMDVPAGKLGTQFNKFLSGSTSENATIPVTIGLAGTYDNPQPRLLMAEQKDQIGEAAKDRAKEEVKEGVSDLLKGVKDEKAREAIGNILGKDQKDSIVQDSTTTTPVDEREKAREEAKDKIRDLFKKKKTGDGN